MNLSATNPYHTLHIVPKSQPQALPTRPLDVESGIRWSMVAEILMRFGWTLEVETDLFIVATHPQSNFTLQLSHMAQGQILVNQDYVMLAVSDLHMLEAIADEPNTYNMLPPESFLDKVRNWVQWAP